MFELVANLGEWLILIIFRLIGQKFYESAKYYDGGPPIYHSTETLSRGSRAPSPIKYVSV